MKPTHFSDKSPSSGRRMKKNVKLIHQFLHANFKIHKI